MGGRRSAIRFVEESGINRKAIGYEGKDFEFRSISESASGYKLIFNDQDCALNKNKLASYEYVQYIYSEGAQSFQFCV